MTRIVVQDKRNRGSLKARYVYDKKFDNKLIPDNIPLTDKARENYSPDKIFVTFRGLNDNDIISILSAVKRQEACLSVDRMGNAAYYRIIKK